MIDMAHFAKLDENNIVEQVIVVANEDILDKDGNESEEVGALLCSESLGGVWLQTSYNGNFRKNYAGIGYSYDATRDAFIPPMPMRTDKTFVLDEATCRWVAQEDI